MYVLPFIFVIAIVLTLPILLVTEAFSTAAGSCDHAGVTHGLDLFQAQPGSGGHSVYISGSGRALAEAGKSGAALPLILSGPQPYKGLLVSVVDKSGHPVGGWAEEHLTRTVQVHPLCAWAVTHTEQHAGTPSAVDTLHYLPPQGLAQGGNLTLRVTVVRDYATWWAFEHTYIMGKETPQLKPPNLGGGGSTGVLLRGESSSRSRALAPGVHSPGNSAQPRPYKAVRAPAPGGQVSWRLWPKWVSARLHAFLMCSTFLLLAPTGVLAARYLKNADPPVSSTLWFTLHVRLQYAAVACATVGLLLALIELSPINAPYWHGQLGLTATGLLLLQPLNAWIRPDKSVPRSRALWCILHFWSGRFALLLGMLNVLSGLQIALDHAWGYMILWIAYAVATGGLVLGVGFWLELRKKFENERTRMQKS